ncbi:MAG: DUF4383 domain-containing protein [Solirubrobacteraceae bacterium]
MTTVNPTGPRSGYPAERRTDGSTTTRTEKGISLARGPALILGTILTAVGLYLLYKARTFPPFSNFPNGTATKDGDYIFGLFAANGWTAMLTAVAGALLLFGAAQHLLAKTMSLIVGVALGAAAVIALISGDVLGMAAANGWTELGWGACAVILLFNTLVPRRRRTVVVADEAAPAGAAPVAERDEPMAHRGVRDDPYVGRDDSYADRGDDRYVDRADDPAREEPGAMRGDDPTAVRHDQAVPTPETRRQ